VDLPYEEVESLISQISLGGKLELVENSRGSKVLLYFKHPMRKDLALATFYEIAAVELAKKRGLPTVETLEETLIERGLWSEAEEVEIESFRSRIEGQQGVLKKAVERGFNRDRIEGVIKNLQEEMFNKQRKKEINLEHTVERKAQEEKYLYLTFAGTYIPTSEKKYWPTLQHFKDETDIVFRRNAALKYTIFSAGLPTKTIRYIARTSQWLVGYMAAQKNGGKLLDREVFDYSTDMINLMYWSGFYLSLQEMMPEDRPSEDLVADDPALDMYMEKYFKEEKQKAVEARAQKASGGKQSSAWDHQELIVTKSNPVFDDIDFSPTPAAIKREQGKEGGEVDFEAGKKKKR